MSEYSDQGTFPTHRLLLKRGNLENGQCAGPERNPDNKAPNISTQSIDREISAMYLGRLHHRSKE